MRLRVPARQVTSLIRDTSGRIIAATSNPGKVFSLGVTRAATGTYDSDVRDAGTVGKMPIPWCCEPSCFRTFMPVQEMV